MLTGEEINEFWFTPGGDFVSFARDIERAVLAKAGEQEPVDYERLLNGEWVKCSKTRYEVTSDPVRALYAHQLPTKAIPEGYQLAPIEPTESMLDAGVAMALQVSVQGEGGWSKYLRGLYKQMLSASPKP